MKKRVVNSSRREFIIRNSLALGAIAGVASSVFGQESRKVIHVRPRYHRWHVDPGVEWLERNTDYATVDWTIPMSQVAVVLVDVWQRHYLKDTEARGEKIIRENLIPLLTKCRAGGMHIIHAPSPEVAKLHPNWVQLVDQSESIKNRDDWPPRDFRNLSGQYATYQRPHEPREAERQNLPELTFHPKVQPISNEPVVASGEELHRYCKKEGILFLFFAGFNTNACILSRDYGTIQMSNRGYQVILVRDCTTGMESKETHATLAQTRGAILLLEMFGQYSITSVEMMNGISS